MLPETLAWGPRIPDPTAIVRRNFTSARAEASRATTEGVRWCLFTTGTVGSDGATAGLKTPTGAGWPDGIRRPIAFLLSCRR